MNDQIRGPKPTKNSVTFMPERFAAKKCAASCNMMISGSVRTTPTIATCVGNTSAYAKSSSAPAIVEQHRLAAADAYLLERIPHATLLRSTETCARSRAISVGGKNVGYFIGTSRARVQHFLDDLGDAGPRDALGEERLDRDLVGRAQHRRRGAAGAAGLVGQREATERRRGRAART